MQIKRDLLSCAVAIFFFRTSDMVMFGNHVIFAVSGIFH